MKTVALAGNPNAGKTTIFNALTGGEEQVGNWPGTTVELVEGTFLVGKEKVRLVDLPGIYGLSAFSLDEKIARDFLLKEKVDLVVVVVDASNLERNLYLLVQIREMGLPVVVALNMWDEMEKLGADLDERVFARIVGACGVVKTVGNQGKGIDELKGAIAFCLGVRSSAGALRVDYGPEVESFLQEAEKMGLNRFLALAFLEGEEDAIATVPPEVRDYLTKAREDLRTEYSPNLAVFIAERRYGFIKALLKESLRRVVDLNQRLAFTEYVDRIITNRVVGIPLFLLVMYGVFTGVFKVAQPFVDAIESAMSALSAWVGSSLSSLGAPDLLVSFLTNGVLDGVGSILVFVPNIFFLNLFISVLEDSGYLARAAFIMDKFMHRLGLHGKSFIPMLIGFGCNVPAIMATRTLSNEKDRIITTLIIPFMSCSARLPVYVLFASVFFPGKENIVVFGLYLLGIGVGVVSAMVLNRILFKGQDSLLIMEMPPYRVPSARVVLKFSWIRTFEFIRKAWTVILVAVILVWLLASLPPGVEYGAKDSLLGRMGTAMAPVFSPAGFGFWQAAVALVFGVVAKEVVVGTLGTLLSGGKESALRTVLPFYFTQLSALSFLVMTLLYIPCVATIAVIKKELGWRWAVISTVYTIAIGWILSVLVYQLGRIWF